MVFDKQSDANLKQQICFDVLFLYLLNFSD